MDLPQNPQKIPQILAIWKFGVMIRGDEAGGRRLPDDGLIMIKPMTRRVLRNGTDDAFERGEF
jgi:hypothetical protein